jgi:hypothetical protein
MTNIDKKNEPASKGERLYEKCETLEIINVFPSLFKLVWTFRLTKQDLFLPKQHFG